MSQSWYARLGVVCIALIGALAFLVWSVGQWDTEAEREIKRGAEQAGRDFKPIKEPPAWAEWFPEYKIKLGLDLQGGIDLVLQVDVEEAVQTAMSRAIDPFKNGLESVEVTDVDIQKDPKEAELIVLVSESDGDKVRDYVRTSYTILQLVSVDSAADGKQELRLGYSDLHLENLRTNAIQQQIETIRNRIDEFGVNEPVIMARGGYRINIQLPGVDDPDRAVNLIGQTARLEFRMVDETIAQNQLVSIVNGKAAELGPTWTDEQMNAAIVDRLPADSMVFWERDFNEVTKRLERGLPHLLYKEVALTGDLLDDASVQNDPTTNEPNVSFTLNPQGARIFAKLSRENIGKQMAIVLDDNVKSAPVFRSEIPGGRGQITLGQGGFEQLFREAGDLALVLRSGALPAPMYIEENRTVGATLGADSIRKGINSMLLGFILVVLLILAYYRVAGIGASFALVVNVLLLLGLLAMLQATLTLPGIAGIILTVGMAVDANVIINERIREEYLAGRTPASAVALGYQNATRTILDANVTTLLAGVVLFQYGTGPIKGFAVTLIFGILTSLFSAILVTRLIFDWRTEKQRITELSI